MKETKDIKGLRKQLDLNKEEDKDSREILTDKLRNLRELYNKVAIIETNQLIAEAKTIIELINTKLNLKDD